MRRLCIALTLAICSTDCGQPSHSAQVADEPGGSGGGGSGGSGPVGDASTNPAVAIQAGLKTKNSIGRTGSFFLPAGYNQAPTPTMVAYHGTGGSGADMVTSFHDQAVAHGFIVVAPDSRQAPSGEFTWQVGDHAGDVTEDYTHTLDCIAEVRAMAGVQIDETRVIAVGYSGGGSSAPYIATNETLFGAYAVLHGGVIAGGVGTNVIRGWFSTGDSDTMRPASLVQQSVDYMKSIGFADVTFKTFSGGHELSTPEITAVVAWWLGA